jgi:hypothetical protein
MENRGLFILRFTEPIRGTLEACYPALAIVVRSGGVQTVEDCQFTFLIVAIFAAFR